MIVCPLEKDGKIPQSVSLATSRCGKAHNNLNIINNQPTNGTKNEFGVCSKQLHFKDRKFGVRFIEWVHLLRILGAHQIHLYKEIVHKDVEKVVDYLHEKNLIEIDAFLAPSDLKSTTFHTVERRTLEMNLLHDCLYRVKNLYKYIIVIDTDEIIMPTMESHRNWHDLMNHVKESNAKKFDYYAVRYLGYLPEKEVQEDDFEVIPSFFYMLRHIFVSAFELNVSN
jgi:hypothetical protein